MVEFAYALMLSLIWIRVPPASCRYQLTGTFLYTHLPGQAWQRNHIALIEWEQLLGRLVVNSAQLADLFHIQHGLAIGAAYQVFQVVPIGFFLSGHGVFLLRNPLKFSVSHG